MTVSSLWNVLDDNSCGRPVGLDSFPLRDDHRGRKATFAVDTSIWICEAIASTALASFHSDPALYLIYQRTTKLLKCGFGLIFVLEGANRNISNDGKQVLRKRRSGSQFFAATKRCETLLRMLGVPVVYAEAEGEALCALLNEKGIADGVISNDADSFLFGAKTLYTQFTLDNLDKSSVMRYDVDRLQAAVDGNNRTIKLSRKDLVAFALLTGSDMTGGIANVGNKKAIRFIDAIRSLTQQPDEATCLDKLLSWGRDPIKQAEIQVDVDDDGPSTIQTRCCSLCLHPGSKDAHARNGCSECGTAAGEGCFVVTSMEKIVTSLQQKIAKAQHWSPEAVAEAYFSPNGNLIPNTLASVRSATCIASPAAAELFQTNLILKGKSQSSSQEYVRQTLPHLLARLDLFSNAPRNVYATLSNQKYKPIPVRIEKTLVKKTMPCYEVIWAIAVDAPSEQQIGFSTHEFQSLINRAFPRIVESFHREERQKQRGLIEQERHSLFVGSKKPRYQSQQQREKQFNRSMRPAQGRKRERNFDAHVLKKPRAMLEKSPQMQSHDVAMLMDHMRPLKSDAACGVEVDNNRDPYDGEDEDWTHSHEQNSNPKGTAPSLDVSYAVETKASSEYASLDESVCSSDDHSKERDTNNASLLKSRSSQDSAPVNNHLDMPSLSPNQERIFCNLGMYIVECTPIRRTNF